MWLVDLHTHTAAGSDDSSATLAGLASAVGGRQVDAFCVTDHDRFNGILGPVGNAIVFPGAEVNTDAGHVLVFGLSGYEFGFHHPLRLAEAAESAGAAMIWAHPYRRALLPGVAPNTPAWDEALARASANPLANLVHAVESINGRGNDIENRFAAELAGLLGLPQTGASDAHADVDGGKVATAFDEPPPKDAASLAKLIRRGRCRPFRPLAAGRKPRSQ